MARKSHSVEKGSVQRPPRGIYRCFCALSYVSLMWCLGLTLTSPIPAVGEDSAGEYDVKAAILFNLTRFVEWPPSSYPDSQAPTVICILGRDPFGNSLRSMTSKQTSTSRPVQVRQITNHVGARGCHVLYISSSERKSVPQILRAVQGANILTVAELSQFAAKGGMVQFELEEKQVHFSINLDASLRADLKISSRLLVLARIIKDQASDSAELSAH